MIGVRKSIIVSAWLILYGNSWTGLTSELNWNPQKKTLDAFLKNEPVSEVILKLGKLTGWKVWIEPGLEANVSVRFTELPVHHALPRILGDWHYTLLPEPLGGRRLYIYKSLLSATEELSLSRNSDGEESEQIKNELIVIPGKSFTEDIKELAQLFGAEIVGNSTKLGAWLFRFDNERQTEEVRMKLAQNDSVRTEANYRLTIPSYSLYGGPLNQILPEIRANKNPNTDHLVVALIDTPVQADTPVLSEFLLPPISVAGELGQIKSDKLTHGTAMALSFLHGLAYLTHPEGFGSNVRILPINVYDTSKKTSTFQLALGIVVGMDSGARFFNMSFEGHGSSPILKRVIQEAHRQGAVFVGAVGNKTENGLHYDFPAAYPEFLAVTSWTQTGELAPNANIGKFVDVIFSGDMYIYHGDRTHFIRGASVASAVVAGITVGYAAESGKTLRQAEKMIRQTLSSSNDR